MPRTVVLHARRCLHRDLPLRGEDEGRACRGDRGRVGGACAPQDARGQEQASRPRARLPLPLLRPDDAHGRGCLSAQGDPASAALVHRRTLQPSAGRRGPRAAGVQPPAHARARPPLTVTDPDGAHRVRSPKGGSVDRGTHSPVPTRRDLATRARRGRGDGRCSEPPRDREGAWCLAEHGRIDWRARVRKARGASAGAAREPPSTLIRAVQTLAEMPKPTSKEPLRGSRPSVGGDLKCSRTRICKCRVRTRRRRA